ncbi:MAG: DUF3108 domain-containing protein [Desulfobacteraceae bacterium]|jgi:hypothetical protein
MCSIRLKKKLLKIALLLCTVTWVIFSNSSAFSVEEQPFRPGERLVFELRWAFVPAGEAVLEVLPIENINGMDVYHFVMTANSNSFVDAFYKVRDQIDAYVDIAMNGSVFYSKKQREGSTKRDITVAFDQKNLTAVYQEKGKDKRQIKIVPGTFDPLSVFYFARTLGMNAGMQIQKSVSDGKKVVIGKANIVRREKIKVPAGTYDTFLLEPELEEIGGVFEKSKDAKMQIWVTANKAHIPVKIESSVMVGRFIGELVSVSGLP